MFRALQIQPLAVHFENEKLFSFLFAFVEIFYTHTSPQHPPALS